MIFVIFIKISISISSSKLCVIMFLISCSSDKKQITGYIFHDIIRIHILGAKFEGDTSTFESIFFILFKSIHLQTLLSPQLEILVFQFQMWTLK